MTTERPHWKISNGDISATGHPIHFKFGYRWGFLGQRIEWRYYFRFDQIQDGGRPPSWKILNKYTPICAMHYSSHFQEIVRSFAGKRERIMREE